MYEVTVVEEVASTTVEKSLEEWEVVSSRSSHGGGMGEPAEVWEARSDVTPRGYNSKHLGILEGSMEANQNLSLNGLLRTGEEDLFEGKEFVSPSRQPYSNGPMGVVHVENGETVKLLELVVNGEESTLLKSLPQDEGHVVEQVGGTKKGVGMGEREGEERVLLQVRDQQERVMPPTSGDASFVLGPDMEVDSIVVGPNLSLSSDGPEGGFASCLPIQDIPAGSLRTEAREVSLVNKHVRFSLENSDLSDFSDSIEDLGEDQEKKALHKVKKRSKRKALGGGKVPPLVSFSFVQMAVSFKGNNGKGKKIYKDRYSLDLGGTEEVECGREVEMREVVSGASEVNKCVTTSPPSGLRLILDGERSHVLETPLVDTCVDPLKKLEAKSLFGIQNGLGFSFTTPSQINIDRLDGMEVVDVKKKVLRESSFVDQ